MRIAIDASSEVGKRAARILLAERDLEVLGIIEGPTSSTDDRVERARDDLGAYDVVVTTDPSPAALFERAHAAGAATVAWVDEADVGAGSRERTELYGANLASGIARCLVSHEAAVLADHRDLSVAWTEPGRPLRRGVAVPFPEPVGPTWADVRSEREGLTELAAPIEGEWAGALARVSGPSGTNIVGVADLAVHLEALSLAAGAATTARGHIAAGRQQPVAAAEHYLLTVMEMGLDVAAYRE